MLSFDAVNVLIGVYEFESERRAVQQEAIPRPLALFKAGPRAVLSAHRRIRAIAFKIFPIKYSFSVAAGEGNEDHLLICKHEKLKTHGFFSRNRRLN